MHKLLERQLKKARGDGDVVDSEALFVLVSKAYEEADLDRDRQGRSNRVLSDELTQMNAQIREEANMRVQSILNAVSEGIVTIRSDGTIEAINRAAEAIFELEKGAVTGKHVDLLGIESLFSAGLHAESKAKRPDGTTFPIEYSLSDTFLGEKAVRICIVRDVTERRDHERKLRDLIEKAQAASRAKSDFLATMSHEIRTPMNGVLGMTGLLNDTELDVMQRSYVDAIRDSGEALLLIINDILDFSKIEAGKVELESQEFDPHTMVEAVIEILAPRAREKGVTMGSVMTRNVPRKLIGDAGRVRQILTNLVGNAVKFTDEGGVRVQGDAERLADGRVKLKLEVIDTGVGVPEGAEEKLFQSFVQLDGSFARRHGGTGLGLAICKRLADLMGGEVNVSRNPDRGSTFSVAIPLISYEQPDSAVSQTAPQMRVLVVDDNAVNRQVIEQQLIAVGMRVAVVESGDAALAELFKAVAVGDPFRVAVLDHQMPGMGGDELAMTIKGFPALNGIELILASSAGHAELRLADNKPLFRAVLRKPVHQTSLTRVLQEIALISQESLVPPSSSKGGAGGSAPSASSSAKASPPSAAKRSTPKPSVAKVATKKLRVLVVDDNPINVRVACGFLERAGHYVESALSGAEAIEAVRSRRFDVVIMDAQMPEIDGFEATNEIRKLPGESANVPIVALTANAMKGDREKCIAVGMDDYLSKPVDRAALVEKVAHWGAVGRGRMRPVSPSEPLKRTPERPTGMIRPVATQLEDAVWEASDTELVKGRLETFADLGGAVARWYEEFCENALGYATELGSAPLRGDRVALGKKGHSIRGEASSLGLMRVARAALAVESTCRSGGDTAQPVEQLRRHLKVAVDYLKSEAFLALINRVVTR